ncbi:MULTISPECIES: alpha/beta fold hydrolase [Oxalobacteraceae]|jgi:2-hydroxymuconate-semialdehyde hydrolase|uniref:Alpha/beta fold hydrolase n=1 Tax=Massilia suwonensis TaxID=648895 RepID=A0ABW0MFT6_9BURK|nr:MULTISPECIES: alpha/beta fold hydrolase [Herbaspirillum]TQK01088.1 2-hydroxymuconate semialdehyde hydrolase [Herbaspirillum sp. SJZ107]
MTTNPNPEIGKTVVANGVKTNYHEQGEGAPVLLIHGSGPGVTGWANWRLTMPALARQFRVLAPDMVGFGYTERPAGVQYNMDTWVSHIIDFMDALGIERAHVVGNSFGGGLALALAIRAPQRVNRLVLMGSAGIAFPITEGLDRVWGYTPSLDNMRGLLDVFAYNRNLVNDELARMRYEASIRPGFQEAFSQMFPAPRQRGVDGLASPVEAIRALPHETMVVHGREDKVIPLESSYQLFGLIPKSQLHVFGQCGHWTQIEHAARFNQLVGDFFAEGED